MLQTLLIVVHVIVCIALIMIVLLQTGKGADMGAAFGGGSSQTLFGSGGASTFPSKATTVAAVVFMLTSLFLAYVSSDRTGGSVISDDPAPAQSEQSEKPDQSSTDSTTQEQTATPEATADSDPTATDAGGTSNVEPTESETPGTNSAAEEETDQNSN